MSMPMDNVRCDKARATRYNHRLAKERRRQVRDRQRDAIKSLQMARKHLSMAAFHGCDLSHYGQLTALRDQLDAVAKSINEYLERFEY
jgi:hypothetical protein